MNKIRTLEIVIATRNPGKVREIKEMLGRLQVRLRSLDEFPKILPVEELGSSYEENATLKALGYAQQTGLFALADDSGLEVDALGGGPGVFSARFGGEHLSDTERTAKLLAAISNSPNSERRARFVCVMAFATWPSEASQDGAPRLLHRTEGICDGVIAREGYGANGFGFDPIFIPNGHRRTFADLPTEVKNRISHRAKALLQMREFLKDFLVPLDRSSGHP